MNPVFKSFIMKSVEQSVDACGPGEGIKVLPVPSPGSLYAYFRGDGWVVGDACVIHKKLSQIDADKAEGEAKVREVFDVPDGVIIPTERLLADFKAFFHTNRENLSLLV